VKPAFVRDKFTKLAVTSCPDSPGKKAKKRVYLVCLLNKIDALKNMNSSVVRRGLSKNNIIFENLLH